MPSSGQRFVSQSLSLARMLQNSIFSTARIVNIRTNFNKLKISVQIEKEEMLEQLLKVTELGQYRIKCYQPKTHCEIKGVISGVGMETDMSELMDIINEQNESKVALAIRLNKGKEKIPSYSIKLIFSECTKKKHPNMCTFILNDSELKNSRNLCYNVLNVRIMAIVAATAVAKRDVLSVQAIISIKTVPRKKYSVRTVKAIIPLAIMDVKKQKKPSK